MTSSVVDLTQPIVADSTQSILEEAQSNGVTFPPGDLYSDEPQLESTLHLRQMILLLNCLEWLWKERTDYFCAGNLTVYYSPRQLKSEDFRGPDFFVALNTQKHPRKSWVVWEEDGNYPNIIVELLSDSTATTDRTLKKRIYQDTFRTPDYFWFDPTSLEFQGFHLVSGTYEPLQPNASGHLWSQQLELYLGVHGGALRFFTPEGTLIPTSQEAATAAEQQVSIAQAEVEAERQNAEAERQNAEAEKIRNAQLAAKLRELGIDPETL